MIADLTYLHNIDPFAIKLWGGFGIRWYSLAYLCGFLSGYLTMLGMAKWGLSPLKPEQAGDCIFWCAVGTIIGGRLGYCLFYSPDLFFQFSSSFPFWSVLAINEGGMASHGGIIGIAIAAILFARRFNVPALHVFDLCTLGGAIGIFFGRIANFINGELVGRACEKNCFFAVKFPQDILSWPINSPEKLHKLAPVIKEAGVDPNSWLSWLSSYRFNSSSWEHINETLNLIIFKIQQGNQLLAIKLEPLLLSRHPSQLYEALLEGLLIVVLLSVIWLRPQKPGVIASYFGLIYTIVRIFGEQFRLPDAHIGYQLFNLTRGQWLSIAMIPIFVIALISCKRRSVPEIGGLLSRRKSLVQKKK